jgi:hypothetical protein
MSLTGGFQGRHRYHCYLSDRLDSCVCDHTSSPFYKYDFNATILPAEAATAHLSCELQRSLWYSEHGVDLSVDSAIVWESLTV